MMPAPNSPVRRPVWPWMLAVGLVGGSQLFWIFQLRVDASLSAPAPASPPPLRVVNTASENSMAGWERIHVWSPTLFALPDSVGFSQPSREREIAVRPPIDRPPAMSLQLQERTPAGELEPAVALLDSRTFVRRTAEAVPVVPLPAPDLPESAMPGSETGPRVTLMESTPPRDVEHSIWWTEETGWGEQSWTAEGMLYVNDLGVITHAMLDMRPADAGRKDQVLRALRRWRWQPAAGETIVRIGLSYHAPRRGANHDG